MNKVQLQKLREETDPKKLRAVAMNLDLQLGAAIAVICKNNLYSSFRYEETKRFEDIRKRYEARNNSKASSNAKGSEPS